MDGSNNDQNEAAIITPALKPKMVFNTFLFTSLKKHTINAPKRVIPQVKVVAIRACKIGFKSPNQFNFIHLYRYGMKKLRRSSFIML